MPKIASWKWVVKDENIAFIIRSSYLKIQKQRKRRKRNEISQRNKLPCREKWKSIIKNQENARNLEAVNKRS